MPGRTIERLNVQLSAEDQRLRNGLRSSENAVRRARQRINRDVGLIARRGAQAFAAFTAASGTAVTALAQQAVEVDRLAQSIGATAEEYQVLEEAFNQAGADGDAVAAVINRLNEVIAEARNGAEPLRRTLSNIGLSFTDLEQLSPVDALGLLIDSLNSLTDETERSRAGLELFQGDFERNGVLFRQGSSLFNRLREVLNRNGGLVSQASIDRVAALSQALGTASRIARVNFFEGFLANAPALTGISDNFDVVADAARNLGETIGSISSFLIEHRNLVLSIGAAYGALTIGRPFVQFVGGVVGGVNSLIGAMARNTAAQRRLARSLDNNTDSNRDPRQQSGSGANPVNQAAAAFGGAVAGRQAQEASSIFGRIFNFLTTTSRVTPGPDPTTNNLDPDGRPRPARPARREPPRTSSFGAFFSDIYRQPFTHLGNFLANPLGSYRSNRVEYGHGFRNTLYNTFRTYSEDVAAAVADGARLSLRDRYRILRQSYNLSLPLVAIPESRDRLPPAPAPVDLLLRRRRDIPTGYLYRDRPGRSPNLDGRDYVSPARSVPVTPFALSLIRATSALGVFAGAVTLHGQNLDRTSQTLLRLDQSLRDITLDPPSFFARLNRFLSAPNLGPGRGLPDPIDDDAPRLPRGNPNAPFSEEGAELNRRILAESFLRLRATEILTATGQDNRLPLGRSVDETQARLIIRRAINDAFVDLFSENPSDQARSLIERVLEDEDFLREYRLQFTPLPLTNIDAALASQRVSRTGGGDITSSNTDALGPRRSTSIQGFINDGTGEALANYYDVLFGVAGNIRDRAEDASQNASQIVTVISETAEQIDAYEEQILRQQRDRQRAIDEEYAAALEEIDRYDREITLLQQQRAQERRDALAEQEAEIDAYDRQIRQIQQERSRQRQEEAANRLSEIDRYEREILEQQRRLGDAQALRLENERIDGLTPSQAAIELQPNFYDNFAQRFGDDMRNAFLRLDLSGSFSDFAESVLTSIANSFRESLADQIGAFFGNLVQGIFSNRGTGEGFFGTLLSLPFSGGAASDPRTTLRSGAGGTINLGAAFERAPRFADGGYIPGPPGTAVPVVAHAGELVLNQTQQAALFSAVNSGSLGGDGSIFNFNATFTGDTTQQTLDDVRREAEAVARISQAESRERGYANGVI